MSVYIGTSGYHYKGWYHGGKPSIREYSTHLKFVELNSTFYKTPSISAVKNWKDSTPSDFRFTVKCNRYLTHNKKLIGFELLYPNFHEAIANLDEKLLGVLIQLPPSFRNSRNKSKVDGLTPLQRLKKCCEFTKCQYPETTFYIEFRHRSWFCDEVRDVLIDRWSMVFTHLNNTLSAYGTEINDGNSPPLDTNFITIPDKIYFRYHGTWSYPRYTGGYSDEELVLILSMFQKHTIVAFDNTDSMENLVPHALLNAKGLEALI